MYNEDTLVQQTTADYLIQQLNWDESIYAFDEKLGKEGTLGRENETEVVLKRYLGMKLIELNPDLPEQAYKDGLRQIVEVSAAQSLLAINREKYELFKNGVDVSFRNAQNQLIKKRLKIFDFDNHGNNHFLVVREFWIKGDIYRRRADIVGFINGIPLIFMELKNVHKDVKAAYLKNFSDYKDTIPHLFHHNAVVILGNGIEAKIGSVSAKYEHFGDWKRLSEDEPGVVEMETLLKGVCSRNNFLDLFENYLMFDDSGEKTAKIVARNHQFLGVNQALTALQNSEQNQGKLGVFWHTQGSGKSYSIAFFVRKIQRKLGGNYTFLILTDREDLDTQIYKTFAGCGLADNDKDPCRASSGEHLKALLSEQKACIFSLIQKFNQAVSPDNPYSYRSDIIVITDEAHRTQYGVLSLNLRNALPNASFIGFTGTPLFKDDEITRRVFGDYVSTYDFQRAVEDGATVPLYYDARGEKLKFKDENGDEYSVADPKSLNEKIAAKLEELEIDDVNVEQRLERELKRDYHIITASKRLEQIAEDFVEHYGTAWESGKAMLVCLDKITCVRMHQLIKIFWDAKIAALEKQLLQAADAQEEIFRQRQLQWLRETAIEVVISEEQGEVDKFRQWDLDILPYRKRIKDGFVQADGKRLDLETAFKQDQHPFRVAIVCAMWLTGFDVPSLATLYLDKPLKAHTLMQAIARANRVSEGKNNGLIVDYCGILKNLREALASFGSQKDNGHQQQKNETEPAKPNEELLTDLEYAIGLVKTFLKGNGFDLHEIITAEGFARNAAIDKAKEAVNENDNSRKQFEVMAREVFKLFKACITIRPQINSYRAEYDAINIIYKALAKDREQADISQIMRELWKLVDAAIDTQPNRVNEPSNPYDISKINFDRLRKEFEKLSNKKTTVQNLRQAIENRLQKLLAQNPLRIDFQKHYEDIVYQYNQEKDRLTIEQTFEALFKFEQSLDEEERRVIRENLPDQETLAVFDLLKKSDLNKDEIKQMKTVAVKLLETLKTEKLKIANWRENQFVRDSVRQSIYDFLYDERTGLTASYSSDDIFSISGAVYNHIYRVYPTLPSPFYG